MLLIAVLGETYPAELSRFSGATIPSVQSTLDLLEHEGLISTQQRVVRLVTLNPAYPPAKELKALLLRVVDGYPAYRNIAESVRRRALGAKNGAPHRYFVTGTDTDVGKTRVAAALALALRRAGNAPTVVKIVQTGVGPGGEGDASRAGALAGVAHVELARFQKPADPWSAALAQRAALHASDLAARIDALPGALVVEGSGGMMVPINEREHLADVARLAKLEVVLAIGLRLGCMSHALLTLESCRNAGISVAGAVLVERWGETEAAYREDVERVLQGKSPVLGILPFAPAEAGSVAAGADLLLPCVDGDG